MQGDYEEIALNIVKIQDHYILNIQNSQISEESPFRYPNTRSSTIIDRTIQINFGSITEVITWLQQNSKYHEPYSTITPQQLIDRNHDVGICPLCDDRGPLGTPCCECEDSGMIFS